MSRLSIITVVLVWLVTGCAAMPGSVSENNALPTPTTHPYLVEETLIVTSSPAIMLTPSPANLQEMADATLTAAAAPPSALDTPSSPTSNGLEMAFPSPTATPTSTRQPEVQPLYRAVYLRNGPGTNYNIIRLLREGDIVWVIAKDGEQALWYNVELENGMRGWVALSVSEPVFEFTMKNIPIAVTIPPLPTPTYAFLPAGADNDN